MESDKHHVVYEHYRIDKATGELKRYYQGCSEMSEKHPGDWSPAERGGVTFCYILPKGDALKDYMYFSQLPGYGVALCSKKDPFCYKRARAIAKGRAEKMFRGEMSSERLKQINDKVRETFPAEKVQHG